MDVWKHLDKEILRSRLKKTGPVHAYPSEASRIGKNPVTNMDMTIGACLRKQYYRYKNQLIERGHTTGKLYETTDLSATDLWKFAASFDTEHTIVEKSKEAGIWAENNKSFHMSELNMKGELDLILMEPDTGKLIGVDVKSVYGYYGEKQVFGTKSDWSKGRKGTPKEDHVMQIALYTWYWRDEIAYFKILYFSRGSGQRQEYTISLEPDGEDFKVMIDDKYAGWNISAMLDRYEALINATKTNTLPPREYDLYYSTEYIDALAEAGELSKTDKTKWDKGSKVVKGDWRCSYCSFKPNCYDSKGHPVNDEIIGQYEIKHLTHATSYDNSINLKDHILSQGLESEDIKISLMCDDETTVLFEGEGKDYVNKPLHTSVHKVPSKEEE
tara:strand:+ start:6518 stop:7672 length:1155 start_codon:yes stop_codon:yes gene_type:complete